MSRPVAIFTSRTEAELARARLELEGIPSHILTDDAGGWEPQFGLSRGVRLVVADHELAAAAEILDLPENVPDPVRPPSREFDRLYRYAAWAMIAFVLFGLIQALRLVF